MWEMGAAFQAAVASSHRVAVTATIGPWVGDQTDVTPWVVGGSVQVDRTRAVRRSCTLEVSDPTGDVVPGAATDMFAPTAGQFLRLGRGVQYPDGSTEIAPLGVFRVSKATPKEGADGVTMTVEGSDLAWPITRATWVKPWAIAAGTTAEAAIAGIVGDRLTVDVTMNLQATGYQLPALIYGLGGEDSSDPWTACQSIATDAGYDLYFDQAGELTMQPTPSPASGAVATYSEDALKVVLSAERGWDGDTMYNGVIIQAENPSLAVPLRAEAWDLNPGSPTYRYGALGEMAEVVSSDRIQTQNQADAAAYERLKRRQGQGVSLSWEQVVNPALDAGDVVRVVRPGLRLDDKFVIDSLEVPMLAAEAMSATGRTTSSLVSE